MMRRALVALCVVATPATAGPCMVRQLVPQAMTPRDTVIEDGGGVMIDAGLGDDPGGVRLPDVTRQPGWRFRDGAKLVVPTIEALAPGLSVYRLPAAGASLVLENDKHVEIARVKRSPDRGAALLPAPMPTSIEWERRTSFRSSTDMVTVHLIAPAPAHAAVMIIYGPDKVARSWGLVTRGAKDVVAYESGGRCSMTVPGNTTSNAGDHITVAWVDASGRVSAPSRELEVTAAKTP
jgi:hypothetical protein